MKITTDDIEFVKELGFISPTEFFQCKKEKINSLIDEVFCTEKQLYENEICFGIWDYFLIKKYSDKSQYDSMIKLAQSNQLQENILCLAGSGKNFHGFHKRSWIADGGNIHLTIHLAPKQKIENFSPGFLVLSALSVVQSINSIPQLKNYAKIKWVNDILIENAKVSGVLAHTLTQGEKVNSVILGIGLNVEKKPIIDGDDFVPITACLNDFIKEEKKIKQKDIVKKLIEFIEINYKKLLSGDYSFLINQYREYSAISNKEVIIKSDDLSNSNTIIAQGRVLNIGDNLELYIDTQQNPVLNGRLILKNN